MALARPASPAPAPSRLIAWLRIVAALVFAMVVVGGITRLTESGLSITEWKPITGATTSSPARPSRIARCGLQTSRSNRSSGKPSAQLSNSFSTCAPASTCMAR
ncbi:MAG: COX15/CtaA family protein [Rhodospirillaceae bacterium]|nr:COX15/CtaA family protein [Rhodospirillaceae bacterium]